MADFTLRLEKGILSNKKYDEESNKTSFIIITNDKKEIMEFCISGQIRNVQNGDDASFLYNINNNEFKAFVFNKDELDKKNDKEDSKSEKSHHQEDQSIIKMASDWKDNIDFLNDKKWFHIRYSNNVCNDVQLNQVYKAINNSNLSSTLKIGFQDYLSKLKHVRYKNIMEIEKEYMIFIKKQATKAMGKK